MDQCLVSQRLCPLDVEDDKVEEGTEVDAKERKDREGPCGSVEGDRRVVSTESRRVLCGPTQATIEVVKEFGVAWVVLSPSKADGAQNDARHGKRVEVSQKEELGRDEHKDDDGSDGEHGGEDWTVSCLEHLGEADADGEGGGDEQEEVGDLGRGVAVQEAAHVDRVLKSDAIDDDGLDDDLQLGLDEGLNVQDLLLHHLLLLHHIPRYQSQTNTKQPIKI